MSTPPSFRARLAIVALLILAMPFCQATVGDAIRLPIPGAAAQEATDASDPSFIAARAAHLGVLPDEPRAAARALVDVILGPDAGDAQIATMELLRQAGIPVISIPGAVVALPDRYLQWNAPMLGSCCPT